ncbi:hypothetical protein VA596_39355 [Amycolatopsis sp., V23-08]|uniref:Secreted protein n=1 Tax=Amycolatopsis heterodermiae TaxID=3110235 RepID=A0ABU5RIT5_9PSEU|nr:hypothetical protein [Amycolatopsis sp., V23-08]MEA5365639.1 hypothetical protein [Amycolatopsis sp., V23-08]
MRLLLATLGVIGLLALFVAGGTGVVLGIVEQAEAGNVYDVGFAKDGDSCSGSGVYFAEFDGAPLACGPVAGRPLSVHPVFPGFSPEQNTAVEDLAHELGGDGPGLTADDEQRIQDEVDRIAASLPEGSRPRHGRAVLFDSWWGADLAWSSGAVGLAAGAGFFLVIRRLWLEPPA